MDVIAVMKRLTVRGISVICAFLLVTTFITACLHREQPERLAKLQQIVPHLPATSSDSATTAQALVLDTVPVITHHVIVKTSKGSFTLELYGRDAPKAVENFVALAKRRFFDNMLVHRVAKNFMIQSGDPKTKDKRKKDEWGTGGESIYGEPFADEINPDAPSCKNGYKRGTLATANRGPDTNTSQFFVCVRDVPELPRQYTIFGAVSTGMAIVDSISVEQIQPMINETDGRPLKPVVIRSIRVIPSKR